MISRKTIGRLSRYRRLLLTLQGAGAAHVYSHQLARLSGVTAAQVRRDLMAIGYRGSPKRGYEVDECLASISSFIDGPDVQNVVLVGVGRLGRSLLGHFAGESPRLRIIACFDTDPELVGTSIEGVPCHSADVIEDVVARLGARIGVIAVPPSAAQSTAAGLVRAGARSIISFAAVPLRVPDDVFVDYIDLTSALESAAFFARKGQADEGEAQGAESEADQAAETLAPQALDSLLDEATIDLAEIADIIGARVVTPGHAGGVPISRVYAGDRVSDLLNEASEATLLVTNLASVQMVRVAELMDVPGICFVDGIEPEPEMIDLARSNGTLLMVSPQGVYDTCGRIYGMLSESRESAPASV